MCLHVLKVGYKSKLLVKNKQKFMSSRKDCAFFNVRMSVQRVEILGQGTIIQKYMYYFLSSLYI